MQPQTHCYNCQYHQSATDRLDMTIVDDIHASLDITDVLTDYLPLTKSGSRYKAHCPFHAERTPSFIVSPERQSWRCFGACATGGDIFAFVMLHQNVDFPRSVEILAHKAGIDRNHLSTREADQRVQIHTMNSIAATFFHDCLSLPEHEAALRYLKDRGFSEKTISQFQIGYAPNTWDSLKIHLSSSGFSTEQSVTAGLLQQHNKTRRTWDFFRDRIIFPILERNGAVTGFGGRQLGQPPHQSPKYINTPTTPVFNKTSALYGIQRAHESVKNSNTAVIVEGYTDVLAAHQHGYKNVVASMGTALTQAQATFIRNIAASVILALDQDYAGQEATLRSLETSWKVIGQQTSQPQSILTPSAPVSLRIANLPDGKDPAQLITEEPERWDSIIKNATPLVDHLITSAATRFDVSTGTGKKQAADLVYPLIAATANPFDRHRYERALAHSLSVTLEDLRAAAAPARRVKKKFPSAPEPQTPPDFATPHNSRERYLLYLLADRPYLRDSAKDLSPDLFSSTLDRELLTHLLGDNPQPAPELTAYLDDLLTQHTPPDTPQKAARALKECAEYLRHQHTLSLQEQILLSR